MMQHEMEQLAVLIKDKNRYTLCQGIIFTMLRQKLHAHIEPERISQFTRKTLFCIFAGNVGIGT
jgi:hypothetical protein